MKNHLTIFSLFCVSGFVAAQENINYLPQLNDTIKTVSEKKLLPKVNHAEPLYIDLMRDLGAKKGEAEVNLGFKIASHQEYIAYNGFIEYEWAIADHLGMEVEIPFSFNNKNSNNEGSFNVPNNKIEGLKLATQYTFLVNEQHKTSMAIAYIHEFELNNFKELGRQKTAFTGMKMNPVFIAAKNLKDFNTLIYTGPVIEHTYKTDKITVGGTINTSIMYVIPNSKNFVGIENNMDIGKKSFYYTLRPQLKLALKNNFSIGVVTGIPITKHNDTNLDIMTRIIWEP